MKDLSVLTQLNPPLPMETSKGPGWAHFIIDYGPESALLWVVFMDRDGACWTVPNAEVRMCFNWTMGRRQPEQAQKPAAIARADAPDGASVSFHPSFAGPKAS
jgi:hypothetical protein